MAVTQVKSPISRSLHYIVVGAGVMGCTLAYELSKITKVTLIEKNKIGSATVPIALLNPFRGRSARASTLDLAGLKAMRALANELSNLGLDHGIHNKGVLRIASNNKQARKWQELQGVLWFGPEDFPSNYNAPFGGFLVASGGFVNTHKFLKALVKAAKNNLTVIEDCQVLDIKSTSHANFGLPDSYSIKTNQGDFEASAVFLCVGANTSLAAILPKMTYTAGEVVTLKDTTQIPYPLAGAVYSTQVAEKVYIGGNHRPLGEEDVEAAKKLQHSVSWFIPSLKTAQRIGTWTGARAKAKDNQPIIRELKPKLWFLGALAGRGFLCAAYLAKMLVKDLQDPCTLAPQESFSRKISK